MPSHYWETGGQKLHAPSLSTETCFPLLNSGKSVARGKLFFTNFAGNLMCQNIACEFLPVDNFACSFSLRTPKTFAEIVDVHKNKLGGKFIQC